MGALKITTAGMLAVAMLAACQTPPKADPEPTTVEKMLGDSSDRIESLMVDLYGARIAKATRAADVRLDTPVTIAFEGEASKLVAHLAGLVGMKFKEKGRTKLPLPVSIDAKGMPVADVLERIGYQLGGRADIALTREGLELRYAN